MSLYKYIRQAYQEDSDQIKQLDRERLIAWRQGDATVRVERPTRLDRARSLGYKAKPGILVVRQRIMRGAHKRPRPVGGRRPKRFHRQKHLNVNYQTIAEQRVSDKYPNCEVLNSYFIMKDGNYGWYEVILVERDNPVIKADPQLRFMAQKHNKGRVYRGLTSSAKKTRKMIVNPHA